MFETRVEPFAELNRVRNEMERLFDRWSGAEPRRFGPSAYPPVDMWQDEENLYLEAELPGFELSDLDMYVTGRNQLTLNGERKRPEIEGGRWHRRERGFGKFNRVIELPCEVESDKVSAELAQGVLTITLPKAEEVKPRRIQVRGV